MFFQNVLIFYIFYILVFFFNLIKFYIHQIKAILRKLFQNKKRIKVKGKFKEDHSWDLFLNKTFNDLDYLFNKLFEISEF